MAFANAPEAARFVTSRYSFRLLTDYDPPSDRAPEAAPHIDVIAGGSDELMDAAAYQSPFHRSVYMLSYCLTLIIWGSSTNLPRSPRFSRWPSHRRPQGQRCSRLVMRSPTSRSSARQLVSA
jgi:hypothetical protein